MSGTIGRPPKWTPEAKASAQAHICDQLVIGRSLRAICRDAAMPNRSVVMEWIREDERFADQYARARELQADYLADEIIEIADTATDANLARVQIDARKWTAGKLKPKVYGDRLNLDATMAMTITDEQREARIGQLLRKAGMRATTHDE